MPKLVRLYIQSVALGFGLAAVFVGLLLWLDVAGLGRLVHEAPMGWVAVLMIFVFHGLVFAGVQFAIAVMRLADADDTPRGGNRARVTGRPPTVALAASRRRPV